MPLLKRKAFEKSTASGYLRDDDEVFHCEITDEIFKDYEEYCERIILVNSMVWSCEMTGKNNLTYAEALESEKAARRSLKDFPLELRTPILYLAAKTKRCSFAEMSEDVFNYVRDRYFIGETVEACLEGDSWKEAHVLSVTAPKQQPGSIAMPPASAYCYEVEQFEDESSQGQVCTSSHERVRRRKGIFSRDKCRLFLKQFVEMQIGGIIGIKKSALDKYHVGKLNFDQVFTGNPPIFPSSKKLTKTSASPPSASKAKPGTSQAKPGSASKLKGVKKTPDKKGQQSMDKFVKKTDKGDASAKKPDSAQKSKTSEASKKSSQDLAAKMRLAEEMMKQKKEEEKARKKEKHVRLQAYLKEWHKVKDDLELEDHKIIPKGTPIDLEGIPHSHIGDFLSVLEFVHLYADTLKTKDVFHNGLDVDSLRKMLTVKEHTGMLSDLVQMMLTTIFSLQEDEAEEYNEGRGIAESTSQVVTTGELGMTNAIELATKACKWPQTYLGTPLSKLHLDPTTVTEVLRLHILSSGGAPGSRCATWRYQQRGGYSSSDDAGLHLRLQHPELVRRLAITHVADLPIEDKFRLLQCLMNQILSYATVRDIIEEKIESIKTMKHELRLQQIQEKKRVGELSNARLKLRKEASAKKAEEKLTGDAAKEVDDQLAVALEKLEKEAEAKKAASQKKIQQLQEDCFQHLSYIGTDRAYRRYWLNQCIGGLFVEAGDENRGVCADKPVLPATTDEDPLAYVTKLFEREREKASSDKENDSGANSRGNSPKKPLSNLNGLSQKLTGLESNLQLMKDLNVCTGDNASCYVHGKGEHRPRWCVYHSEEHIDALILSLNKRGVRESELRHALERDRQRIVQYVAKCPLSMLTPCVAPPPLQSSRLKKFQPSIVIPPDCSVSEALELSLRDYILELEEKIFHGCLGAIKVKDREAWRGTIMLRGYDKQAAYLSWGPAAQFRDDYHLPNGVLRLPNAGKDIDKSEDSTIAVNKYRDPGFYLYEAPKVNGIKVEVNSVKSEVNGVKSEGTDDAEPERPSPEVVRGLASALLQVEQGIHHKYLKRPLGLDDKERKEREAKGKTLEFEALERWEVSLMECQSFAQVVLHLFTLDSSVTWSASILNASCRICRRKTDPDNMLLCDSCNKGHHMYCLKPKLTKVPPGDWFCDGCKPKEQRTPRKRRKLFSDSDIEEAMQEEESDSDDLGLCGLCGSGGRLSVLCQQCEARFHAECAQPKPTRAAKRWTCAQCLNPHRDSEDSESDSALVTMVTKSRKSRNSKEPSPAVNGHANGQTSRRSRKSKEETNTSKSRKSRGSHADTPLANGVHEERGKKRSLRAEPLHTEALEELLKDVMKHRDCWPFYDPVSVEDVPDYLDVIDTPMDFTTIRNKLTAGEYATDAEFLQDSGLVFNNCFTYNLDTHPVTKACIRLEKFFNKRCGELHLPALEASGAPPAEPPAKRAKQAK